MLSLAINAVIRQRAEIRLWMRGSCKSGICESQHFDLAGLCESAHQRLCVLAQDRQGRGCHDGIPSRSSSLPLSLSHVWLCVDGGCEHAPGFLVIIKVRKNAFFIEMGELEI